MPSKKIDKLFEKAVKAASSTRQVGGARTSIPSQEQYERNSLDIALKKERRVEALPLAERKENQAKYLQALQEPGGRLLKERIGWLLDGNYGYGEMQRAKNVVANKRSNRTAALGILIALYEWSTPRRMAALVWHKLDHAQKARVTETINQAIAEYENDEERPYTD